MSERNAPRRASAEGVSKKGLDQGIDTGREYPKRSERKSGGELLGRGQPRAHIDEKRGKGPLPNQRRKLRSVSLQWGRPHKRGNFTRWLKNKSTEKVLSQYSISQTSEPPPEGGGVYWEGLRTPPKEFGFELPGPEGPGFRGPVKAELLIHQFLAKTPQERAFSK